MGNKFRHFMFLTIFTMVACTSNGPQQALDKMAKALENFDSTAFLAQMDMTAYASNKLKNITENDQTLNSLNTIGDMLGLGNLDELINNVVDFKGRLTQNFERGVASGQIMAECRTSDTPDCPWVPQSLRDAKIVELNKDAAIARITTPAQLTSWLALRKINDKWQVVGQAVMENRARAYALAGSSALRGQPTQPKNKPVQKAPVDI